MVHAACFGAYYELGQIGSKLESDDPVDTVHARLRLDAAIDQIYRSYFVVRRSVWRGSKDALRALHQSDPDYFALLRQILAEPDLKIKLHLYEKLVWLTLGPPAEPGYPTTHFEFSPGRAREGFLEEGARFWSSLLASAPSAQAGM
jgi:hypothetical protein